MKTSCEERNTDSLAPKEKFPSIDIVIGAVISCLAFAKIFDVVVRPYGQKQRGPVAADFAAL